MALKDKLIGARCTSTPCFVLQRQKLTCTLRQAPRSLHVRKIASSTTLSTERNWNQSETPPSAQAAQPQVQSYSSSFKWLSYWYPVQVLATTDPSRPHAIELLGKQLVLWRDGQSKWRCMEDLCPHRLAPLSEGRIESDGTLQCSYHGWRFNSQGRCTEIPQAVDEKAKAVACSSSRSCVTSYPVREDGGLIWVWPSAGAAAEAEAEAAPTPLGKLVLEDHRSGKPQGVWYRRELPYSWDVLVENLTDPSHLPFSHHKLTPNLHRENGDFPMPFKAIQIPAGDTPEDAAARPGYVLEHRAPLAAFEFPSAMSPHGRVAFTPPLNVTYAYSIGPTNTLLNDLIAVPAGPGRSIAYTSGRNDLKVVEFKDLVTALFTSPKSLPMQVTRYLYQRQGASAGHLIMNKLFDQDSLFLHMQDRQLALKGRSSWNKNYYMPTPSDSLAVVGRKWADFALQLPLPVSRVAGTDTAPTAADVIALSAAEAAMAQPGTQREVGDRYNQHTKHCTLCQRALKGLEERLQRAHTAAAALTAAAIGVLAGVVVPGMVAAASAGAGGAATSAAASAAVSSGVVAWAAAAVVLGLAAHFARRTAAATAEKIAQFHYVEFKHADNH